MSLDHEDFKMLEDNGKDIILGLYHIKKSLAFIVEKLDGYTNNDDNINATFGKVAAKQIELASEIYKVKEAALKNESAISALEAKIDKVERNVLEGLKCASKDMSAMVDLYDSLKRKIKDGKE